MTPLQPQRLRSKKREDVSDSGNEPAAALTDGKGVFVGSSLWRKDSTEVQRERQRQATLGDEEQFIKRLGWEEIQK